MSHSFFVRYADKKNRLTLPNNPQEIRRDKGYAKSSVQNLKLLTEIPLENERPKQSVDIHYFIAPIL